MLTSPGFPSPQPAPQPRQPMPDSDAAARLGGFIGSKPPTQKPIPTRYQQNPIRGRSWSGAQYNPMISAVGGAQLGGRTPRRRGFNANLRKQYHTFLGGRNSARPQRMGNFRRRAARGFGDVAGIAKKPGFGGLLPDTGRIPSRQPGYPVPTQPPKQPIYRTQPIQPSPEYQLQDLSRPY